MDPKKILKGGKSPFKLKIKINLWTIAIALMIIFFVVPVIITGYQMSQSGNKVEVSQLMGDIKDNKVDKVLIENSKLIVTYKDGSTKFSTKEDAQSFSDLLEEARPSFLRKANKILHSPMLQGLMKLKKNLKRLSTFLKIQQNTKKLEQ